MDGLLIGRVIRHYRRRAGLTLDGVAAATGISPSRLSMFENGRSEPRLSQLEALASALGVAVSDLLSEETLDERTALELELARAQRSPLYRELGLPAIQPTRVLPTPVLQSLVGLHRELHQRAARSIATPEEARRANTELRREMRNRDNYLPEIEDAAEALLSVIDRGAERGALTHHEVELLAAHLGFSVVHVADLPRSTRSVTDLASGRIYLPPASIPGGHGLRALALQALAHRVLGHKNPSSYADFLRQRMEIAYFSSACLLPRQAAASFLRDAKDRRDLAVADLRDAFGVTHEVASIRMTNLATSHLDVRMHFLRVGGDGAIQKAYENDGLTLPMDVSGSLEGQTVDRVWAARAAFEGSGRSAEFHQITDTPDGTYWCSTQTGATEVDEYSITVGVPFDDSRHFRGRDTDRRATATNASSSRATEKDRADRWEGRAWPSARLHAHILSPLPAGTFPGVDDDEVFRFLESHSSG